MLNLHSKWRGPILHCLWTIVAVGVITIIGGILSSLNHPMHVAILYLLPVLLSAARWGRGPSLLASVLGVACFDYFFVTPVFGFRPHNPQDLILLGVFILVALVTGTIATRLKGELEQAREREKRTKALYHLSKEVAAYTDLQRILEALVRTVGGIIGRPVVLIMPDAETGRFREVISHAAQSALPQGWEDKLARRLQEIPEVAGRETDANGETLFYPIRGRGKPVGVIAVRRADEDRTVSPEQQQLIAASANLASLAINRAQLAREAEQANLLAESQKLQSALLNSLSHYLRTPLASIQGAVTALLGSENLYDETSRTDLLRAIEEGACRMNRVVSNLLDMVHLETGMPKSKRQWCDIQDIVGVALRDAADMLGERALRVEIPSDLPPVKVDFPLIQHVFINLVENAAKYSPPETAITISARQEHEEVVVTVSDCGQPIPPSEGERIFERFYRLKRSQKASGVGLGLSICKGIIEAHGGRIWLEQGSSQGNRFTFSLPPDGHPTHLHRTGADEPKAA